VKPEGTPTRSGRLRLVAIIGGAVVLGGAISGIVYALTRDNGSSSSATGIHASGSTTSKNGKSGSTAKGGASKTSTSRASTGNAAPGGGQGGNSPTTASGAPSGGSKSGTKATLPGGKPVPTTKRTLPPDTAPPDITAAYTSAFNAECHSIWANAGSDGIFIDADNTDGGSYTVEDCLSQLEPDFAGSWDNVADARQGGVDDADSAAESLTVGNRFITTGGRIYNIP
jgi:hypothetical protein